MIPGGHPLSTTPLQSLSIRSQTSILAGSGVHVFVLPLTQAGTVLTQGPIP